MYPTSHLPYSSLPFNPPAGKYFVLTYMLVPLVFMIPCDAVLITTCTLLLISLIRQYLLIHQPVSFSCVYYDSAMLITISHLFSSLTTPCSPLPFNPLVGKYFLLTYMLVPLVTPCDAMFNNYMYPISLFSSITTYCSSLPFLSQASKSS